MYHISNLLHRTDISMGAHGFCIYLSPEWKELVARSKLSQGNINQLLDNNARDWLDGCGYDSMVDPDNSGFDRDPNKPLGPKSYKLYRPREIRVSWGEWGIEHLTVPGNACGLDIDSHAFGGPFRGGSALTPHNIDCLRQKYLMLVVFTTVAEAILYEADFGKGK